MEVLERFAQGDLGAFEALFRQFQVQVYGWTMRIVRGRLIISTKSRPDRRLRIHRRAGSREGR